MLGLVAISPDMFALLLGDKWMPTVPYFEILALSGMVYPLSVVSYNILKVKSDGRVILRLEILKRLLMTLVLLYTIPQGVESIAWGMTAMAAIDFCINTLFALRYLDMGVVRLLRLLLPQLSLAAVMFGVLYLLNPHFADFTLGVRLLIDVAIGVVFYAVGSAVLRLRAFNDLWSLLCSMVVKSE
jgi:O-antigen/teichoic acid export membrane protein